MKAQCKQCGTWFPITRELEKLIEEEIISPLDINICPMCAELDEERAVYEEENRYYFNEW
jgi:hypothetical protein